MAPLENTFWKHVYHERALVQLNSHSDSSGSLRRDIDKRSAFQIRDKSPLKNWLVRHSHATTRFRSNCASCWPWVVDQTYQLIDLTSNWFLESKEEWQSYHQRGRSEVCFDFFSYIIFESTHSSLQLVVVQERDGKKENQEKEKEKRQARIIWLI